MNKKVVVAIILAILLAAFGIGLYASNSNKSAPSTNIPKAVEQPAQQAPKIGELFQKAMSSGSLKCTFAGNSLSGTSYIKNGMVRLDSISPTNVNSHVIFKDKIVWTWNEGESKGIMMDTSQLDAKVTPAQGVESPEEIQRQIEANQPNCNEENISDLVFEIPKNVKFTDFSKMMKSVPQVTLPEGFEMPSGIPQN